MIFEELDLPGVVAIHFEKKSDSRGFFARAYCREEFESHGLETEWVQMNHTLTHQKGALRGLHFQREPHTETKIVRCIRGTIFDVVVDLRKGSGSYGRWISIELSDRNRTMLYIPKGCAHGFQTVETDCELLYMHSQFYAPESEGGLLYSDPALSVEWPLAVTEISDRDQKHPHLDEISPITV